MDDARVRDGALLDPHHHLVQVLAHVALVASSRSYGYEISPFQSILLVLYPAIEHLYSQDGFEYPENMNRCMSNNYTVEGFWRSWHRSFNQWYLSFSLCPSIYLLPLSPLSVSPYPYLLMVLLGLFAISMCRSEDRAKACCVGLPMFSLFSQR